MSDQTYYDIQHCHNPGARVEIWDSVETYPFYSNALNRARVMVTDAPKLLGRLRLVRCIPLPSEGITPIIGLRKGN